MKKRDFTVVIAYALFVVQVFGKRNVDASTSKKGVRVMLLIG